MDVVVVVDVVVVDVVVMDVVVVDVVVDNLGTTLMITGTGKAKLSNIIIGGLTHSL